MKERPPTPLNQTMNHSLLDIYKRNKYETRDDLERTCYELYG